MSQVDIVDSLFVNVKEVKTEDDLYERIVQLCVQPGTVQPDQNIIVVDNFYADPMQIRQHALQQEFRVFGNFPGRRTVSFASSALKDKIQQYLSEKIVLFPTPKDTDGQRDVYNGSFQIATSRDHTWFHTDGGNNYAGVLFLTPDAPVQSGTGFYRFWDGTTTLREQLRNGNSKSINDASQDKTKWQKVDSVGNVFNRLVLFKSNRFHKSMKYFGNTLEDARLFQVFFFNTESHVADA